MPFFVRIHDAETACFFERHLNYGDRCVGVLCLMLGKHLGIVHLVDMVAGKDKEVFRRVGINKVDILGNRVCCSAVNIQIGVSLLTGRKYIDTAVFCVQTPAASGCNVTVQ